MITPSETPRSILPASSAEGTVVSSSTADGKFTIYPSSHPPVTADAKVLNADTAADHLVAALASQSIVLVGEPNPTADFHDDDELGKWMKNFDPEATMTLTYATATDPNILGSFQLSLSAFEKSLVFQSTLKDLNQAFGEPSTTPPQFVEPGMLDGKIKILAMALDGDSVELSPTVADVFKYAKLDAKQVPTGMGSFQLSLVNKQRNVVWHDPAAGQTTLRLQFQLESKGTTVFQNMFQAALKGLEVQSLDIVVRRQISRATSSGKPVAVEKGRVLFVATCTQPAKMVALVEFGAAATTIIFDFEPDILTDIIKWFSKITGTDFAFVDWLTANTKTFEDTFQLRRITVSLDSSNPSTPVLSSVWLDVEIPVKFGKSDATQNVLFLATFRWSKESGISFMGDLWTKVLEIQAETLMPQYEPCTAVLKPATIGNALPSSQIDLTSLVPGSTITNVPKNIPTEITALTFSVTEKAIGFSTTFATEKPAPGESVPTFHLGTVALACSYTWGSEASFTFKLGFQATILPIEGSTHQIPAQLAGALSYVSGKWSLSGSMTALYASALCQFFGDESKQVLPILDSIEIKSLTVEYSYEPADEKKSVASHFAFKGALIVYSLEVDIDFQYDTKTGWAFTADLKAAKDKATLGDVIKGLLPADEQDFDLPDFVANMPFNGTGEDAFHIAMTKETNSTKTPTSTPTTAETKAVAKIPESGTVAKAEPEEVKSIQFIANIRFGTALVLTFGQYRDATWTADQPSKRFFRAAVPKLPTIPIPYIDKLEQPFDEALFLWVQDSKGLKEKKTALGLTRKEVSGINANKNLADKLVFKDTAKEGAGTPDDILLAAACHVGVIAKKESGERYVVLDFAFLKPTPKPATATAEITAGSEEAATGELEETAESTDAEDTTPPKVTNGDDDKSSDDASAHAPLKKTSGPIAIRNIGLKYANKALHVLFDADFQLGPLTFAILGFAIELPFVTLDTMPPLDDIKVTIDGLQAGFQKAPLDIAGIINHVKTKDNEYYSGGLIIGMAPWQFEAAGYFGTTSATGSSTSFESVFVFMRLDGPLIELEFAEISGITGGFGYKTDIRFPSIDAVRTFPFVSQDDLGGKTADALTTLQTLTRPSADSWFAPRDNTYWAAVGLKVDAFEMISVDAVLVVEFGDAVKIGLFAVGLVDIPNAASPIKFAHIELGLSVVLDIDHGTLQIDAQLAPTSYILDPDCHLSGGFGLYYWFDGPHADKSRLGDWVFTVGGYHAAFTIPDKYPRPERLTISWSLGSHISITGQSYFAITPKACMGGGKLYAVFKAGPIEAYFDAYADFLIKYRPFYFQGDAGVAVGVRFNIDFLFIHTHISIELSADLELWGPPVAGRAHVHFWIVSFDVNFGSSDASDSHISLLEFYQLVLQASSADTGNLPPNEPPVDPPWNQGHTFTCLTGLLNTDGSKPDRPVDAQWTVRSARFSFLVACKIAVSTATINDETGKTQTGGTVYAKPLKLTTPLDSALQVTIKEEGESESTTWGIAMSKKQVPKALWGVYDPNEDPHTSPDKNNIKDLLNGDDGATELMMGVIITCPPPEIAQENLKMINVDTANTEAIDCTTHKPGPANGQWAPAPPVAGAEQWTAVHDAWKTPAAGAEAQSAFVAAWAAAFQWTEEDPLQPAMPPMLEKGFDDLYVAAPLISVA